MISLTYLKLVITKSVTKSPDQWADFLVQTVAPAVRQADIDHNGVLSAKEVLRLITRIIIGLAH